MPWSRLYNVFVRLYDLHRFQSGPHHTSHLEKTTQAYNILIVHVQIRDIIFGYWLIENYIFAYTLMLEPQI